MSRQILNLKSIRFLLLQLFCVATLPIFADLVEKGRFVRIYSTENISENGNYVLLSSFKGQQFMLSNIASSNGKKLIGVPTSSTNSELPNPNPSCIWKIKQDNTGAYFLESSEGLRICKQSADTDIKVSKETTKTKLRFNISVIDSVFRFALKDNENRALCLSSGYNYFGLFIPSSGGYEDLELYRFEGDTLSLHEATDWSATTFVLGRDSSIVNFGDTLHPTLINASNYWLSTGELASDIPAHYHSTVKNNPSIPIPVDSCGIWRTLHGIPLYFQDSACYTYALNLTGDIIWSKVDSLDGLYLLPLYIIPVAPKSEIKTSDTKTLQLFGGWSQPALQLLNVDKTIVGIDLTNAILPSTLPLLKNTANPNCLYYISDIDTLRLHPLQTFVVACGNDNNQIYRKCNITDKFPFAIDRTCSVEKGMISYIRDLSDSNWNTLYLPFSIQSFHPQIHVEQFDTITSETVRFSVVDKIEAYHPLVFRSDLPRLQLDCDSQVLQPEPQTESLFCGTLYSLNLSQGMALDSIGKNFVKCLSESYILPFRCFLLESLPQSLRIVSNIHYICNNKENHYEYDLLGRSAHSTSPFVIRNRKIVRNTNHKYVNSSRF